MMKDTGTGTIGGNIYFKINEQRLVDLIAAEAELEALHNGGVDNWEWYGMSIRDYLDEYINEVHPDMDEDRRDDFYFEDIAYERLKNYEVVDR